MKRIFTIYDLKACGAIRLFLASTVGEAERTFLDMVTSEKSFLHTHPEDYELVLIGEYEEETMNLKHVDHINIARGSDLVAKKLPSVPSVSVQGNNEIAE